MSDLPTARFLAARHVLTTPKLFARTAPHLRDGRINWVGLLAEWDTMSGGERYLVDLAKRLWTGDALPGEYELEGQLDLLNARRVGEALDYLADEPGHAQAA